MARNLDVARIERARTRAKAKKNDSQDESGVDYEPQGKSELTVIEPELAESTAAVKRLLRAAAYVRVSTQEELQESSFEAQVRHYEDILTNDPRYELVKIYQDKGISGTQVIKRKGFLEMVDDAKQGKIDVIYTKSMSRFGRNAVEILQTLDMLEQLNPPVPVIFETDGIDTANGNSKIIISILAALAELESQLKSEAIKAGIMWRMKDGKYKFSVTNTLGLIRNSKGKVVINEAEADIVRFIYESFLEGASPLEIAEELTNRGISSPNGKLYWRPQAVEAILSNEKYCGDVIYQKYTTVNFKTHKVVKNKTLRKWHWTNQHPAIIDKAAWNKAQTLLEERKWVMKKGHKFRDMPKRFVVQRLKAKHLQGYYLLDPEWTKAEREQFLEILRTELTQNFDN